MLLRDPNGVPTWTLTEPTDTHYSLLKKARELGGKPQEPHPAFGIGKTVNGVCVNPYHSLIITFREGGHIRVLASGELELLHPQEPPYNLRLFDVDGPVTRCHTTIRRLKWVCYAEAAMVVALGLAFLIL